MRPENKKGIRILPTVLLAAAFLALMALLFCLQTKHADQTDDGTVNEMLDYTVQVLDERVAMASSRLNQHKQARLNAAGIVAFDLSEKGVEAGKLPAKETTSLLNLLTSKSSCTYSYLVDRDGNLLAPSEYVDILYPSKTDYLLNYGDINIKEQWGFTDEQWDTMLTGTGRKDNWNFTIYEPYSLTRRYTDDENPAYDSDVNILCYISELLSYTEDGEERSDVFILTAEQETLIVAEYCTGLSVDFANSLSDSVRFAYYDTSYDISDPETLGLPGFTDGTSLHDILLDGYHGEIITTEGVRLFDTRLYPNPLTGYDTYIIAMRDVSVNRLNYAYYNVIIACVAVFVTVMFGRFFKNSDGNSPIQSDCVKIFPKLYLNRLVERKMRPALLLAVCGTLLVSFLITGLSCVSNSMRSVSTMQNKNAETLEVEATMDILLEEAWAENLADTARLLADFLGGSHYAVAMINETDAENAVPYYYINEDGYTRRLLDINGNELTCRTESACLSKFASKLNMMSVSVFSLDGYAIMTTEDDKPERITAESPFYDVLMRKKEYTVSAAGETTVDVAVPISLYTREDPLAGEFYLTEEAYKTAVLAGDTTVSRFDGILVVRMATQQNALFDGITDVFRESQVNSEESYLTMAFSADAEHTPFYVPKVLCDGDTSSMNLPSGLFDGTYYGFAWLNGTRYLLCSRFVEKGVFIDAYWMVTALKATSVFRERLYCVVATVIAVIIACLAATVVLARVSKEEAEALPQQRPSRRDELTTGFPERTGVILPGYMRSPGQRTAILLRRMFFIFLAVLALKAVIQMNQPGNVDVLTWIVSLRWDRGVSIFSLSAVTLIFCAVFSFTHLVTKIIHVVSANVGRRMATCLSVICSVLRYGSIIFSIFYSLYVLGLDTSSVLTSFAAFSMLIGLGANKLIGDIIAGIFLVIENEFHVGDIVTIDGFCGKVTDIGIRTTKVENKDGNVNIFTNSTISSVLNMTSKISRVKVDLIIHGEASVEDVERMLKELLPDIERRCPVPHKNLRYLGMDKAGNEECIYRVEAECNEFARSTMYRYLNRELYLTCKKHGFKVESGEGSQQSSAIQFTTGN